jgi:GNAT superfamily N-acetyltransferase
MSDDYVYTDFPEDGGHRFDVHLDGINVGYAALRVTDAGYLIDAIEIDPRYRGRKLARRLMEKVLEKFGDCHLELWTRPYGDCRLEVFQLQAFYRTFGFVGFADSARMTRPAERQ